MSSLEKVLLALGEQKLKVTVEFEGAQLLEITSKDKNIDLVIKDSEQFKKLMKEIRR